MGNDFEEIGHSGGRITFRIRTGRNGQRTYQVSISGNSAHMVMIGVYALPPGIPVELIQLGGGIGVPWNNAPIPGCIPVLIGSDSEGRFGHTCQICSGYWRSGPWPNVCPYCASRAPAHEFLSEAQLHYVHHYIDVLLQALNVEDDGDTVIDMDAVASAVGKTTERPDFYVSEQSQQRKFACTACDEFNDILGRFGYCSSCGTRNDLADFEQTLVAIRHRLNGGHLPEDCLRDAVAAFDSFMAQLAKQLAALLPMTERRKNRLHKQRFYELTEVRATFRDWFDIDIYAGMNPDDCRLVELKFHRRHVYEHNAGEVDQKYIDDSKDTSVCKKQHIHESIEDTHRLLGALMKMSRNVHTTFHKLFPPIPAPIQAHETREANRARHQAVGGS